VKNLWIADSEITGEAEINLLNNLTLWIDRMTGELSIQDSFHAQCEPQDVTQRVSEATPRQAKGRDSRKRLPAPLP
jgi:hypothetical protein